MPLAPVVPAAEGRSGRRRQRARFRADRPIPPTRQTSTVPGLCATCQDLAHRPEAGGFKVAGCRCLNAGQRSRFRAAGCRSGDARILGQRMHDPPVGRGHFRPPAVHCRAWVGRMKDAGVGRESSRDGAGNRAELAAQTRRDPQRSARINGRPRRSVIHASIVNQQRLATAHGLLVLRVHSDRPAPGERTSGRYTSAPCRAPPHWRQGTRPRGTRRTPRSERHGRYGAEHLPARRSAVPGPG
jgi:hypothetical protein